MSVMSIAGKAKRQAQRQHEQLALRTFRDLARKFHDALYFYSQESNWVMDDSLNAIWVGQGKGPDLAQNALGPQSIRLTDEGVVEVDLVP